MIQNQAFLEILGLFVENDLLEAKHDHSKDSPKCI